MSRSRDNADAVTTVPSGVGRNMIINGGMNVSQRATSVTGIGAADGYFTLDRWNTNVGATSAGRLTQTQTADGPNGISANCLKLDCTTADTSIAAGELLQISHKMEGQNLQRIGKGVSGAKEITVSFYVKGNASATYVVELFDADNTRSIGALFSVTTDWNRIEVTFPADEDDGSSPFDDDNAVSIALNITLHSGSDFTSAALNTVWSNNDTTKRAAGGDSFFDATSRTFFLTGVQMEVGPVATEFEQEDISVTLDKCKRYCQDLSPPTGTASPYIADGYSHNATVVITVIHFSEMRATPTLTLTGTPSDYTSFEANTSRAVTAVAANGMSSNGGGINFTVSSGLTAGRGNGVFLNADITHRSILDSEL